MNVTFNPVVNFKSDTNLIAEAARKMNQEQTRPQTVQLPQDVLDKLNTPQFPQSFPPVVTPIPKYNDDAVKSIMQALKDGENVETMITSKHWNKEYNPHSNSVHAKMPGAMDGLEYDIYSNGKVVTTSGIAGTQKVVKEFDEELAKYVSYMKAEYESKAESKTDIKENSYNLKENNEIELQKKADEFKEALKSRKWEKKYLPESDVIWVKRKRVNDDIEYCIEKDGTVKRTGLHTEPEVIMGANRQISEEFNKIKGKQTKPKKSLWYRFKDGIADTWKFFSATTTMAVATAKGAFNGLITAAGIIAGAMILRVPSALKEGKTVMEILKTPLKSAGTAGKVIAAAAGAVVLTSYAVAGKLRANQDTAVIEHKMNVDHRHKES